MVQVGDSDDVRSSIFTLSKPPPPVDRIVGKQRITHFFVADACGARRRGNPSSSLAQPLAQQALSHSPPVRARALADRPATHVVFNPPDASAPPDAPLAALAARCR